LFQHETKKTKGNAYAILLIILFIKIIFCFTATKAQRQKEAQNIYTYLLSSSCILVPLWQKSLSGEQSKGKGKSDYMLIDTEYC